MAWMLGKDGKMVFVEPGTPVYGEIPAPLAMNIVNPQDGQALVYDGTKGEWVNGEGGGGGSFDPTITNPQDGQAVVYDATAGKWKNGAVDVGWGVGERQLFSETGTTTDGGSYGSAVLNYNKFINSDTIYVTLNGQEYTCEKINLGEFNGYGGVGELGPDFTEFPFALISNQDGENMLYTQTVGAYSITVVGSGVYVTDDFESAVQECVPETPMHFCSSEDTAATLGAAFTRGKVLYFYFYNRLYFVTSGSFAPRGTLNLLPENQNVRAGFDDTGRFFVSENS